MSASQPPPPRRLDLAIAGGRVAGLDWGDPSRPVQVLWLHANGFTARTYATLLAPLGAEMRVAAIDLRGHGATRLPAEPARLTSWRPFAHDAAAVVEALGLESVVLAGHSMGASSALLAAVAPPLALRVRALVLAEPVILPATRALLARGPWGPALLRRTIPWAKAAERRRSRFPDRAAAFAALKGRGVFRPWSDAALADYLAEGVADAPTGEVDLACAPAWEAAAYAAQRHDVRGALRRLGAPLTILKAEHGSTCHLAQGDPILARAGRRATLEVVAGTGHFLPLERPEPVRAALRAAAAGG